jgi:hypothetical protein
VKTRKSFWLILLAVVVLATGTLFFYSYMDYYNLSVGGAVTKILGADKKNQSSVTKPEKRDGKNHANHFAVAKSILAETGMQLHRNTYMVTPRYNTEPDEFYIVVNTSNMTKEFMSKYLKKSYVVNRGSYGVVIHTKTVGGTIKFQDAYIEN